MPPRTPKFGIAEWYGKSYLTLTDAQRLEHARAAKAETAPLPCPFREGTPPCSKAGGVCSIRRYAGADGALQASESGQTAICITCPSRFKQEGMIYRWIGRELLGTEGVANLGEIGFLERVMNQPLPAGASPDEVGRIDNILVVPHSSPLHWCAVETQAVYFSGGGMDGDFDATVELGGRMVFPREQRRPDFRSSGPKRLMPQLQIKVPTLRRWGRKTAVVVDKAFYESMGPMRIESDKSSADIAWFIVACEDGNPHGTLRQVALSFTTLESAVEGLTAGRPLSQDAFEAKIRDRLRDLGLA